MGFFLAGTLAFAGEAEKQVQWPAETKQKSSLTRISILPFTTQDKEDQALGEKIAEALEVLLSESGRFRILMRSEMTLEERNRLLQIQTQQGKTEERAPFQSLTCEEAFLSGSVRRESSGRLDIFLYVISLESGEKIFALRSSIWHENALDRVCRAFAREIVRRVEIRGKVVFVEGEQVFVKMESGTEGVKQGDLLEVRHPSTVVQTPQGPIDTADQEPFTTLVVEALTSTGHLRCKAKEKGSEKPRVGDEVKLIPVLPIPERELVCAVIPFQISEENKQFRELVFQELLVSGGSLHNMRISNPQGIEKFLEKEVDGRVLCDALGVDGVLKGKVIVLENELRAYLELFIRPQKEEYKPLDPDRVIRKKIVLPLKEGKLSPALATTLSEKIIEAFKAEEEKK